MMNKKATFNLQHNEAFEALGVIEAGTHWSAFDVSKTAAQGGEALRFAMAIWTTQGDADDPGGLQPAIIRDRRSGSHWYKFPREGSSPAFRINVWTSLRIASEQGISMFGFLKDEASGGRCSIESKIEISEVVYDVSGTTAWLRLTSQPDGHFGCDVAEEDLAHVLARSSLVDEQWLQHARRPIVVDAKDGDSVGNGVSRRQSEALCRVGEQILLGLKTKVAGVALLRDEFGMHEKTAGNLLRIYAHLVEGTGFTTNPSVPTMEVFITEILTSLGESHRPKLIGSLTGYVEHIEADSGGTDREMRRLLGRLQRGEVTGRPVFWGDAGALAKEVTQLPAHQASEILREVWVRGPQHAAFRSALHGRWGSKCSVHGVSCNGQLRASHIIAWSHDESRRGDVNNGLLLSVPLDNLFDRGLIAFSDDGAMCLSKLLTEETQRHFGVRQGLRLDWDRFSSTDRTEICKNLASHRRTHAGQHGYGS